MAEPTRWITKNGKKIPITGRGGGSKPGTIVVAGLLVLGALGYGGAGGVLAGTGGTSAVGQSVTVRKADGGRAARKGDADEAWRRMGLRTLKQTVKQDLRCVGASFGQVQKFFSHTPCTSLDRMLFAVADDAGNTIVISVAWVGFRTRSQASTFKELIDVHGTGDIKPLGSGLLDLAEIAFTGRHYGSVRTGAMLAVAETEAATGQVDSELLKAIAEVAALLPRP